MREFLFRGLRVSDDKWVYGSFDYSCCEIIGETGNRHYVFLENVSEFTGIRDKTGTMLFVGDIYSDSENTFEIRFGDYEFEGADYYGVHAYSKELQTCAPLCRYDEPVIQLIGNIYQNPELL